MIMEGMMEMKGCQYRFVGEMSIPLRGKTVNTASREGCQYRFAGRQSIPLREKDVNTASREG
jgi:hypothetical protein